MNRLDFQKLAEERLRDAVALLLAEQYSGAYYLAGYAVECALKACIARKTRSEDFPPRDASKLYTHDLARLLELSGLQAGFTQARKADPRLNEYWLVVKDWTEESRYGSYSKQQAESLITAIEDQQHGVLQCLRRDW